jgi:hypothetical protein
MKGGRKMKKMSFGKKVGLGAKDAVASALIAQGAIWWNQGNQILGSVFMVVGGILFIIDYFTGD